LTTEWSQLSQTSRKHPTLIPDLIVPTAGPPCSSPVRPLSPQTAFDCLLYYPILIAGGFTVNLVVLDGKDWDYLREKFRQVRARVAGSPWPTDGDTHQWPSSKFQVIVCFPSSLLPPVSDPLRQIWEAGRGLFHPLLKDHFCPFSISPLVRCLWLLREGGGWRRLAVPHPPCFP